MQPNYKANAAIGDRRKEGKDHYFKYREKGHMAWQCPKKNLYVDVEAQEAPIREGGKGNDSGNEIGPLNVDDFEEVEEDTSLFSVVRHILVAPMQKEDWKRTLIFQTIVRCGSEAQMLIINSGSAMNVVSKATVERLKLPTKPHLKPYKVASINITSIPITEQCLVFISRGQYNDSI